MVSTALSSKRVLCEHRTFTHVHKHAHEVPVFQCSAAMSIERGIASKVVLVTAVVTRMKWAVRLVLFFGISGCDLVLFVQKIKCECAPWTCMDVPEGDAEGEWATTELHMRPKRRPERLAGGHALRIAASVPQASRPGPGPRFRIATKCGHQSLRSEENKL